MNDIGKMLIGTGLLLVLVGLLLILGGRLHLPLGRLPGDLVFRGRNSAFYFPVVTCILFSIAVSVIAYLVSRFTR